MTSTYRADAVTIGNITLGGGAPVRIQSMTNTPTHRVSDSVAQCVELVKAGAELVRLTTQGKREVAALAAIRNQLTEAGVTVPLVADIHFNPRLALEAAGVADKIRINPGNYLKGMAVDTLLPELLDRCRNTGTALRIGVNHGSLHPTILEKYGDTPLGMTESAMEFLRVCRDRGFHRVVVSLKSSNPRVMVQSVRLLVHTMVGEGISCPLHLGVTEAGEGEDGRIRSAVGIAPLLLEGMGDTVRVSLTGPPAEELPVASSLVSLFARPEQLPYDPFKGVPWDPFSFRRRISRPVAGIGNGSKIRLITRLPPEPGTDPLPEEVLPHLVRYEQWLQDPARLREEKGVLMLDQGDRRIPEVKASLARFCRSNRFTPVIFRPRFPPAGDPEEVLRMAGELGSLLVDGVLDAVWADTGRNDAGQWNETLLQILQASGARISRTDYIACPSCGRTHFDILERLREVRRATSHLPGLKIAVMGCIVNGPGEMADADYGYVGAGAGRISLYKGKQVAREKLPEEEALSALIQLMKQSGDWIDPAPGE